SLASYLGVGIPLLVRELTSGDNSAIYGATRSFVVGNDNARKAAGNYAGKTTRNHSGKSTCSYSLEPAGNHSCVEFLFDCARVTWSTCESSRNNPVPGVCRNRSKK